MNTLFEDRPILMAALIFFAVWDTIWKLISLWRAAQNNHMGWFVVNGVLSTFGILPIIYLLTHKKKAQNLAQ